MALFFKWAQKSFQRNLAYRLEYYVSLFNALLFMTIFTSIWSALLGDQERSDGLGKIEMVQYAVFATLIKSTISKSRDLIGERVRTGEISIDLLRPVSLLFITLADSVGSWIFQVFSRAIPLIAAAWYFFDVKFPAGLNAPFFLSYFLSFLIFQGILFIMGVSSFFLTENFPIWLFNSASISLLSGAILPLKFLPEIVQKFAIYTPYPYLFYVPTMKLINNSFPFAHALLFQCVAIVITYGIGYYIYRRGIRMLHIQGG